MHKLQAANFIIPKAFWGYIFVFTALVCLVSSELNDLNISSNNNEGDPVRVQARSEHICDEDNCIEEVSNSNTTVKVTNFTDDSEHDADELTRDITGIVTSTQKPNLAKQLSNLNTKLNRQTESQRIPPSPVKPTQGNAGR